jgi:hypothetical protein
MAREVVAEILPPTPGKDAQPSTNLGSNPADQSKVVVRHLTTAKGDSAAILDVEPNNQSTVAVVDLNHWPRQAAHRRGMEHRVYTSKPNPSLSAPGEHHRERKRSRDQISPVEAHSFVYVMMASADFVRTYPFYRSANVDGADWLTPTS